MIDADAICGDRPKGWSATSSWGSEAEEGELVGLRNGSRVLVRPVGPDDKPLFVAGFARLGEESRYRRFLAAKKRLSDDDLAFFTEVDHHGHEALGAVDPTTGEGLAVARYLREPARPDVAEAAIAVIDDWQKRGLGTVLLERLAIRAHDEGITHKFHGSVEESPFGREQRRLFEKALGRPRVPGDQLAAAETRIEKWLVDPKNLWLRGLEFLGVKP